MGYMHGYVGSLSATVPVSDSVWVSGGTDSLPVGHKSFALPRTHHEEAEQPPTAEEEPMNNQRRAEKKLTPDFSQVMLPKPRRP